MPNTLNNFLVKEIGGILKNFVKKFDISKVRLFGFFQALFNAQINLGIDNHFVMLNLELREDLLTKMRLPLVVTEGTIASLTVKFPISYNTSHSKILVDGVTLKVRSLREKKSHFSQDRTEVGKESEVDFKKQRIQDWDLQIKQYFENVSSQTWIKGHINMIIDNMVITFSNINFMFQNEEDIGNPFEINVKVDKLKIFPTDENWVSEVFNKGKKPNRKKFEVTGFAISLKTGSSHPSGSQGGLDPKGNLGSKGGSRAGRSYRSQRDRIKSRYILFPFMFHVHLTLKKQDYFDVSDERFSTLEIHMKNPLILSLAPDQIHILLLAATTLNDLMKIHSNFHLRPGLDISPGGLDSKTSQAWWKYAINAVIAERRTNWSFYKAYRMYKLYERYVIFFKRQKKLVRNNPSCLTPSRLLHTGSKISPSKLKKTSWNQKKNYLGRRSSS